MSCLEEFEEYMKAYDKEKLAYIKGRIVNQIDWYDMKAQKYKKWYYNISIFSIIIMLSIPVITSGLEFFCIGARGLVISALSMSAGIAASIMNLFQYNKLWIQYRDNCEKLKSILYRFFSKVCEFSDCDDDARFKMLVEISERVMDEEHSHWKSGMKKCRDYYGQNGQKSYSVNFNI